MGNMELYEKMRSVPQEARKQIAGGRLKGFTDINPMWRIKKLTETFGPCGFGWYTDEVERWTESSNGVVGAFVKIHLYVKMNDEWSRPIVGIGGSSLVAQEKSGLVFSDEAFKMAYTDAISVACKALGMAADVYFEKDCRSRDNMTKYDQYDGWQQPEKFPRPQKASPARKRLVRGSGAWVKAVERIARGEEGLMEKLRSSYVWDEQTEADFSEDVFNYNLESRDDDGQIKTA